MTHIQKHDRRSTQAATTLVAIVAVAAGLFLLLFASDASAALQQVATFAESGEAQQLESAKSIAVNVNGAGGVTPGTIYAISSKRRVLQYGPRGEFESAWGWDVSEPASSPHAYERCGPAGEAAHPHCNEVSGVPGESPGQFSEMFGIAVDQATGDVYVLCGRALSRQHDLIQIFSAEGQIIGGFGDLGSATETFNEGPGNIHEPSASGIAVDRAGTVYLTDRKVKTPESPTEETRVMVFKPQNAGEFADYVYAGRGSDISSAGSQIATDEHGNVYLATEERVSEFAGGAPGTPTWQYTIPGGGERAMTVDPTNGEVFLYIYKTRVGRQLRSCSPGGACEVEEFSVRPKTEEIYGLAFDPILEWEGRSRPPGVLFAADGAANGRGVVFARPPEAPPLIEAQSVSSVTSSSALLHAVVDPQGSATGYVVQYIDAESYEENPPDDRFAGSREAPLGGGSIPQEQAGVAVAVSLTDLPPNAGFHFRFIATSRCKEQEPEALCTAVGTDREFRTYPDGAATLPDERAYELVSPPEKKSGEVIPLRPEYGSCGTECKPGVASQPFARQVSPDGDAIAYEGFAFSSSEGAPVFNDYISRRTGSGWENANPTPAQLGASAGEGYKAFDPSLSAGLLFQGPTALTGAAPAEFANLYEQSTTAPSGLESLLDTSPPNRVSGKAADGFNMVYAGASNDLSRVFFAANDALTLATASSPAAVDGGPTKNNLYEWSEGQLRLMNVAPGNGATEPGAAFGSGTALGSGNTNAPQNVFAHAISNDGSRVFWSSPSGQLYVRLDGDVTREIPDTGRFLAAAADGSRVLLSDGHLYDLEAGTITDLTDGQSGFKGVVGQSESLTHVYFIDSAVLTGEETNSADKKAVEGENNLYSWVPDATSFVGTLAPAVGQQASADEQTAGPIGIGDWQASPSVRSAEASPDGDWLAFVSVVPLTGYDNEGPCGENSGGVFSGPCYEVFLYNSQTRYLSCASCARSGASPLGDSSLPVLTNSEGALPQPLYLLDSGRLYFDSRNSLTARDTNAGVEDVYQYEPGDIGDCTSDEGCVSMISAGTGTADSNFYAASSSGRDVFFTTRDQLVPADQDGLLDLYDAREGGGFASEAELPHAECAGEACQPLAPPAVESTLASSGVAGTPPIPACKSGQVRRGGRCVPKPRTKKKLHHHKKKKKSAHGARNIKKNKGGSK